MLSRQIFMADIFFLYVFSLFCFPFRLPVCADVQLVCTDALRVSTFWQGGWRKYAVWWEKVRDIF